MTAKSVAYSNMLASYQSNAKISSYLAANSISSAKCEADLHATAEYDELRRCLGNDACKGYILDAAREYSPELISGQQNLFTHYKVGQACK